MVEPSSQAAAVPPQPRQPGAPMLAKPEAFDAKVHLLDYWHVIRARLNVFIATFVIIVAVATLYSFVKTKIYRGRCRILIEPSSLKVTKLKGVYDPADVARDFQSRRDFLQTQIELIGSDHLLAKAFAKFSFATREEFRDAIEPLKNFRDLVSVNPTRNTFLVDITFDWKNPQLSADVANYLASLYVNDYRERQLGLSGRGVEKLREHLMEIKKARQDALNALVRFKKKHRLINLDDAHKLLVDRMSSLNEALIEARVDEAATRAVVDSIAAWKQAGGDTAQIPEVLDNKSITAFKLEYLRAQAEMLGLLNKYGKTHPTVETQEKVVKTMERAVQAEISNSVDSVALLYERAKLRSTLLAQGFAKLEDRAFELDDVAGTYRILDDSYKATENSYRLVINRINEINITQSTGELGAGGNIMIIDPAAPPKKHIYPRKGLNIALACVAGMILGAGLCLFLDYLDSTIKSKEEVEQILGVPVLGFVPHLDGKEAETEALHSSHCSLAEAFRTIRTSLNLSIAGRKKRAFAITSANPAEGKTLCAFNLALALARDGKRVLLMETDMRRPRFRKLFGQAAPKKRDGSGLSKVLVEAAELADVIQHHPDLDLLDIAFCGPVPPNPAELLGSKRFKEVLKQALNSYDMVILDSPPILNVADSSILAGTGIPIVFVVRAFSTDRHQVAMAVEQIRTVQGNVVGAIVNNADAPRKGYYGYYYGGRYYYYRSSAYHTDEPETGA